MAMFTMRMKHRIEYDILRSLSQCESTGVNLVRHFLQNDFSVTSFEARL